MQLMVYAIARPLSHGFCALGELGKVSPRSTLLLNNSILLRGRVAAQKHRNRRVASRPSTDTPSRRMDAVSRSAACLPVTLRTQMRYSGRGWPCFAVGARRGTLSREMRREIRRPRFPRMSGNQKRQ